MKRVLFLPGYMGGGFGHISRCLTLGKVLRDNGVEVAFVVAGKHRSPLKEAGFSIYVPHFPARPRSDSAFQPAYLYITDASYQVLRDGFTSFWRLKAAVFELRNIVQRFRPNVLVGDLSLLTGIIGKHLNIPVVQIIRSGMHPIAPRLVWWESPPPEIRPPRVLSMFNRLLSKWKLPELQTPEDLFRGDLYLIPGIPEIEPLSPLPPNTYYVGPLWENTSTETLERPPEFGEPGEPVLYMTIGGGASPVGNVRFFQFLEEVVARLPFRTVISTGKKVGAESLPPSSERVNWVSWIPGDAAIFHSELVFFHGGYGTTMEVVRAGKPSVIFPFHTEQESNGRRLVQQGAAKVVIPENRKKHLQYMERRWKGGRFSLAYQSEFQVSAKQVAETILDVYSQARYREGAARLRKIVKQYPGVEGAIDFIEKLW